MIKTVSVSALAAKQLQRLPLHIIDKFYLWKRSVESIGLERVRKIPGYHDEKLMGNRKGQHSIRLNRKYRAIYEICVDRSIKFVAVLEVTPHEY